MLGGPNSTLTRRGRAGLNLVYVGLIAAAAVSRSGGLAPPSLGLDDLWVALVVKFLTPSGLLTYESPVPMGFVVASKPFHALIDHPELGLQIVPFLCALGLIPLAGWLATRVSGRWEVGLLAAVLVLLHPQAGLYAVRVKQFTWDAALMLTVLGFGLPSLDPTRLARPWLAAGVAGAALVASFNTVFAGAIVLHLLLLQTLLGRASSGTSVRRTLVAVVTFDAFAVLLYFGRFQDQAKDWLLVYWQRHEGFPPVAGFDIPWVQAAAARAYGRWLPPGWRAFTPMAAIGVGWLLLQRRHRWQGLALAAMAVVLPTAALALLYPIGGGRTDYYFQPLLAVAGAIGVGGLAAALQRVVSLAHLQPLARRLRVVLPLAVAAVLFVRVPLPPAFYGSGFGTGDNKDLVAHMDDIVRAGDLVYLRALSRSNVGYYTSEPLEIRFDDPAANIYSFRFTEAELRSTASLKSDLKQGGLPDRVVLVTMMAPPYMLHFHRRMFADAGYGLAFQALHPKKTGAVRLFVRE